MSKDRTSPSGPESNADPQREYLMTLGVQEDILDGWDDAVRSSLLLNLLAGAESMG